MKRPYWIWNEAELRKIRLGGIVAFAAFALSLWWRFRGGTFPFNIVFEAVFLALGIVAIALYMYGARKIR